MALPFIAGIFVGATTVMAYKNRDLLKSKSKEIIDIAKEKVVSTKKIVDSKLKKEEIKTDLQEIKEKPKRKYTKKIVSNKEVVK
ncbi:hypothetical protein AAX26_01066 [Aliarcobacter thereius]|uniref:Uncharacterized protein n=1 Tax=Aliarcobacter thereius TaxID=544718 RepID=A0A1C0B6J9_9BACT|nr:hypothetical protein [Aliarcobacter thereius]OCL86760.1 hypothetical protein AAX26_01066 [Aliarcobacter thereius]OCL98929.1 hypothetical protein AAX29_01439 [Aliarcobacter thereius]TLS72099.1 hypothetical protein FE246_06640 [Aliarcobacter thereius]TLT07355.1 hypothetical protein FE243_05790 [Aliarcobacter thereius]